MHRTIPANLDKAWVAKLILGNNIDTRREQPHPPQHTSENRAGQAQKTTDTYSANPNAKNRSTRRPNPPRLQQIPDSTTRNFGIHYP